MSAPAASETTARPEAVQPTFTWTQRVLLTLISWTGWLAAWLLGSTLRWTVDIEEGGPLREYSDAVIYSFWHRCLLPALFRYRGRRIAVMTSSSFDGEYIARIIERFGFIAVRGSSTRGGTVALLNMGRELAKGHGVAFTVDGPRGPRYVAKRGPVLLASKSGQPLCCFHVALERAWVLRSWDAFMIPKPFSRAVVTISRPLQVPPELTPELRQQYHQEMQTTLDRIRARAEARFTTGTPRCAPGEKSY